MPHWLQVLVATATYGAAGALCAAPYAFTATGDGWDRLVPSAAIAAALLGGLAYAILVPPRGKSRVARGLAVGVVAGTLSHPLAWYLTILWSFWQGQAGAGERPMGPVEGLIAAIVLSVPSEILAGWMTVSVGVGLGIVLARAMAGSEPQPESAPS
jgi:hypothetical protein